MTGIFTSQFTTAQLQARAEEDSLMFCKCEDSTSLVHICGLPPHVAEHTAVAFNRAMQAVPFHDGWTYRGLSGLWYISRDLARGTVYLAQHDEVTGDGDPAWMFADADSLIGCLDAIDDVEAENSCASCFAMVGDDKLSEAEKHTWLCDDCVAAESERRQAMHEMGEDDKAHAAMERAAGL